MFLETAIGGVLKRCSQKFRKSHSKISVPEILFDKVAGLEILTQVFSCEFLKIPFLQNNFWRLLLCFRICFEFPNLGFVISNSRRMFASLYCAYDFILRSLTIFNSGFFKIFKTICILKLKARLKHRESYEKDLHMPYDNKFLCLQCK